MAWRLYFSTHPRYFSNGRLPNGWMSMVRTLLFATDYHQRHGDSLCLLMVDKLLYIKHLMIIPTMMDNRFLNVLIRRTAELSRRGPWH